MGFPCFRDILASSSLLMKVVKDFGSLNKQIFYLLSQQWRIIQRNALVKIHLHPLFGMQAHMPQIASSYYKEPGFAISPSIFASQSDNHLSPLLFCIFLIIHRPSVAASKVSSLPGSREIWQANLSVR